jgi:hypothetical protein
MDSATLDPQALDAWWTLWHEPWRDAHPGWWDVAEDLDAGLRQDGAPDAAAGADHDDNNDDDPLADCTRGLLSLFAHPGPGCRLGYRWFCRHFGIDAALPHPRPFPGAVGVALPALPLAPADLVAAATALGRVGYASHCLTSSRQGLARLFSQDTQTAGDADAWRDALRQARARPLMVADTHAPPPGGGALDLQRWALPLMARLIEDAVPGAWARLRLRVDPRCFTLAPLAPTAYSPALQRQAWRIWRAAAATPFS